MTFRMTRDWWFGIAVAFLIVATVVLVVRQNNNIDTIRANGHQHAALDLRSCQRSLKNRELIAKGFATFAVDPSLDAGTRANLNGLLAEADQLVKDTRTECAARARH